MVRNSLFGSVLLSLLAACSSQPPAETPAPPAETPEPAPPVEAAPVATPESDKPVSARPAEWGYEGDKGPTNWASLSEAYSACAKGAMQSPVDLPSAQTKAAEGFAMSYGNAKVKIAHHEHVEDILDNGHTIQVTVEEGSTIRTAKDTYALKQFHFHTPSENKVDGKQYPLEIHFVHQSAQGDFAVVAAFFEVGKANPTLQKLIDNFPAAKGGETELEGTLDLSLQLAGKMDVFHFLGSFTTPPCTENVEWMLLKTPRVASKEQIAAFAAKLGNNNRPTQDWRTRPVSKTTLAVSEK